MSHFIVRLRERYNIETTPRFVDRITTWLNIDYPLYPVEGDRKAAIIKFNGQLVAIGCAINDGRLAITTALPHYAPAVVKALEGIGTMAIREARRERPDYWTWRRALEFIDRMDSLIALMADGGDIDGTVATYGLLLNSFNSNKVLNYYPGVKDYENAIRSGVFNQSLETVKFARNQMLEYFVSQTRHHYPSSWDLVDVDGRFAVEKVIS